MKGRNITKKELATMIKHRNAGLNNVEISKAMDLGYSTVCSYLKPKKTARKPATHFSVACNEKDFAYVTAKALSEGITKQMVMEKIIKKYKGSWFT